MSGPPTGPATAATGTNRPTSARDEPAGDEPNFADRRSSPATTTPPPRAPPGSRRAGRTCPRARYRRGPARAAPTAPSGGGGRRRAAGRLRRGVRLRGRPRRRAGLGAAARLVDLRRHRPARTPSWPTWSPPRRCARPRTTARPACCAAGRARSSWSRFDIVYPLGRSWCAVRDHRGARCWTPSRGSGSSPARFWRHRTGGLVPMVSGNERSTRAGCCWPPRTARGAAARAGPGRPGPAAGQRRRRRVLDGGRHVAAIRPDGHRPAADRAPRPAADRDRRRAQRPGY